MPISAGPVRQPLRRPNPRRPKSPRRWLDHEGQRPVPDERRHVDYRLAPRRYLPVQPFLNAWRAPSRERVPSAEYRHVGLARGHGPRDALSVLGDMRPLHKYVPRAQQRAAENRNPCGLVLPSRGMERVIPLPHGRAAQRGRSAPAPSCGRPWAAAARPGRAHAGEGTH